MYFPESLYQLSARDQQVTWLEPLFFSELVQLAATVVDTPIFQVPLGRILLLKHARANFAPGAGQNHTGAALSILQPAAIAPNIELDRNFVVGAANVVDVRNWQGTIAIPPEWRIRARATYNSGAIANSQTLMLAGMFIPVGNVARV